MKIIVNKNYVLFDVNTKVNKKEFKATPLEFSFSKDYEGLTCKAVFSAIPKTKDEEVTFYQQPIIDNKCYIPYEVMEAEGILIGVYGYSVDGEELLLRYSPEPKNLWFLEGSYYEGAEDPEEILPSQFEQYVAYLNSQISRLDQMKIETEDLSNGVKISITNSNGITTETTIYDGEKGEQGERGLPGTPGEPGAPGRDGYVQYTAGSNISISDENVISADLSSKQDLLVSGTNIKTINNTSLLGSGNIETEVIQVTSLPLPQAMETGKIFQYIGSDTVDYTKGYFYECKLVNNVYTWVNINVQPVSSGGNGEKTYLITYSESFENALATAQEIFDFYLDKAYFPRILYKIQDYIYELNFAYYIWSQKRYHFYCYRYEDTESNRYGTPTLEYLGSQFYIRIGSNNTTVEDINRVNKSTTNGGYRKFNIAGLYNKITGNSNFQTEINDCSALSVSNTSVFIPTGDYNPSTKKYVDDNVNPTITSDNSTTDYTIASLIGNQSYKLGELTSLTITATTTFDRESVIYFTSGSTPTSVSLPDSITNIGDVPTMTTSSNVNSGTCEANKSYIIAILNNIAVWKAY